MKGSNENRNLLLAGDKKSLSADVGMLWKRAKEFMKNARVFFNPVRKLN